jgi:putative tryptophan/tyrosine transport system substrate-binding protein
MRRREFITLLGGTAVWPFAARAQQAPMPMVGFLNQRHAKARAGILAAFHQGLDEYGYVEGQNVAIEYRWADDDPDRLLELAADLARRQATVIFAAGFPAARAARTATSTIPLVLLTGSDYVQAGIVGSLSRPAGNITGVALLDDQLTAKRLGLLRELVPQATTVAYLTPDLRVGTASDMLHDMLAAASTLGQQLVTAEARSESDFEPAFGTFVERGAGALVVGSAALFNSNSDKLAGLAMRYRIPAIYPFREFAWDGGLISYGANIPDAYHLAGRYVGQILKGAKPADLPVQQSSRFELVINLKTARALGLAVPDRLFAVADEVIE